MEDVQWAVILSHMLPPAQGGQSCAAKALSNLVDALAVLYGLSQWENSISLAEKVVSV